MLVVGAGPAGLSAAAAAAGEGARVIFADDGTALGGSLFGAAGHDRARQAAGNWLARNLARLATFPDVRVLTRTTAFGYYDHNQLALLEKVADHRVPRAGRAASEALACAGAACGDCDRRA